MLIHMCTAAQFAGILSFGVHLSMQFTVGTPRCNAPENVLLRHGAAHGRAHKPTPSSTAKTHPLVALLVAGHGGGGGAHHNGHGPIVRFYVDFPPCYHKVPLVRHHPRTATADASPCSTSEAYQVMFTPPCPTVRCFFQPTVLRAACTIRSLIHTACLVR